MSDSIEISLCLTIAPVDPEIEYPPHSIELLQDRQRKNGSGCVRVGVISARELMPADSNGFSDPFVRIQVGSVSEKGKVVKRNLHPIFCEGFLFELPSGTPARSRRPLACSQSLGSLELLLTKERAQLQQEADAVCAHEAVSVHFHMLRADAATPHASSESTVEGAAARARRS